MSNQAYQDSSRVVKRRRDLIRKFILDKQHQAAFESETRWIEALQRGQEIEDAVQRIEGKYELTITPGHILFMVSSYKADYCIVTGRIVDGQAELFARAGVYCSLPARAFELYTIRRLERNRDERLRAERAGKRVTNAQD